ncbi:porin family protein [Grimontia hollisae]|uniref:Accessory colonization factor AcfA n=2 Tax=Grimontia hollisae TaxID=673 RepID=D0IB42_GRIHO|nr:AcfA family outer membrane beta-barrel protein [Grimontia hollisae]AMG32053.1 porin family protein [Grimontia hollisae]EEY71110.1 accessory colonization factor AcfA [Grimontia hollisae CIP 101886]MDF2184299.1 AcfA family outer membrane beta-barrel protein [Grimontia hollisae]STO44037.1 OmpA-like transmembrane domain [Grimontia hollisae]STO57207.1 OmpA-like transmembrane domain [Grimontia hollisae]
MKKLLLPLLITSSFSASAAPYIGLEYGIGHTNHNVEAHFLQDNLVLKPDLDEGIFSGIVGYSFNDTWAIELGYSQYEPDDGRSQYLGVEKVNGQDYLTEHEWDASIKAKQLSLAPVYHYTLNDKWTAKFKAGLTYTEYKAQANKHKDYELVTNNDVEFSESLYHQSDKSKRVGAMLAAGAEYKVLPKLAIGSNVKYQFDSYADTLSLNIYTNYYF